jgi:hypothetical protein
LSRSVAGAKARVRRVLNGEGRATARRLYGGIFLLTLAIYLLTASGHLLGQDQEYFYRMARSLALEQSFAIEPLVFQGRELAGGRGNDGRFYPQYAPGLSVALAPLALLGRGLAGPMEALRQRYEWGADDLADLGARFLVSYFNAPISAATAALLSVLAVRLGYSARAACFTALVFALATFAWGQARAVFAEPLQTLLLLLAVLLLLRATPRGALLAGASLAAALLVKLTSVLVLPALLLLPDATGRPLWRTPRLLALLLGPVLVGIAAQAAYNLARFGSPLATGYSTGGGGGLDFGGNPLVGLYGLLVSPGRGLVWFAPPVIATVFVARRFTARHPGLGLVLGSLAGLWILVHAFWRDWDSGWGWGPRYLLPILPFLVLPLVESWSSPRARNFMLILAGIGALVQLPGATVDFMASGREASRLFQFQCRGCGNDDFARFRNFGLAGSELKTHTDLLLAGRLDLAWISFSGTWVVPLTFCLVLTLAVTGLLLLRNALGSTAEPTRPPTSPVGRPSPTVETPLPRHRRAARRPR